MTEYRVGLTLTARDAGFTGATREAEAGLERLDRSTDRAAEAQRGFERATRSAAAEQQRMARSGVELERAVRGVVAALAAFGALRVARSIAETGVAVESMTNALAVATGSAEAGADAMAFVRAEADRLGLSLRPAIESFTALAAATRGTAIDAGQTREIFTAVSEAMAVLGRSSNETERALLAIQQVISKGKVSAEELRGQLGEVLPGAFQVAARAMGVSTQALSDMLEQGELFSDDFIPRFARQLRAEFADGVTGAAESARAAFNRFGTTIFDLEVALAEGGFLDAVTESAQELAVVLRDPAVVDGLSTVASAIGDITVFAARNLETIAALAAGYATARIATAGFAAATGGAAIAMRGLNVAMRSNPIGLVAGVAATAAASMIDLGGDTDTATEAIERQARALGRLTDNSRAAALETAELRLQGQRLREQALTAELDSLAADLQAREEERQLLQRSQPNNLALGLVQSHQRQGDSEDIDHARAELEQLQSSIAATRAEIERLKSAETKAGSGDDDPPGRAPKKNPFADAIADAEAELAAIERLRRARQVSPDFERLTAIDIEAEQQTARIVEQAADAKIEVTRRQALELEALVSELLLAQQAERDHAKATREAARAAEETARLHEQTTDDISQRLDQLAPSFERAAAAADRWRDEALAGLDETAAGYAEFAADVERIHEGMLAEAYREDLDRRTDWAAGIERAMAEAEAVQGDWAAVSEDLFDRATRSAEDFFVRLVQGKASLSDFVDFAVAELARLAFQMSISPILQQGLGELGQIFGSLFAPSFGPGAGGSLGSVTGVTPLHEGGVAGRDGQAPRTLPAALFRTAPRYHEGTAAAGLGPREVPAVLLEGERVLTEAQQAATARTISGLAESLRAMAAVSSGRAEVAGGGMNVEIHNHLGGEAEAKASRTPDGGLRIDFLRRLKDDVSGDIAADLRSGQGPVFAAMRDGGLPMSLPRPRANP
ncbi:tape measure protein [Minwuia thermotolerans]|uniref:Uncharacterized protein n=1 Tax=Minwuia thermotolerans TaxID=2056226 RepID=A0A2M9G4Q1_9PROT|nr:tape measure protein [Minwuia thermotolerans]PJK29339.1 hypothetical protein CVT23_12100 [Minwuia thermotolerans]PJK30476.1 hypothetical protein CVT23_05895 [Minwuia thermotolerans]PJK30699.1 hypothetical protein CVT23_04845 [Minwuia thermotolerans]